MGSAGPPTGTIATRSTGSQAGSSYEPRIEDIEGRRDRLFRAELRAYAVDRPEVRVVDLWEQLCPNGDCEQPPRDSIWRYDGLHYSAEVARAIADLITPQLLAPLMEERSLRRGAPAIRDRFGDRRRPRPDP